jgi:hypothetical protein
MGELTTTICFTFAVLLLLTGNVWSADFQKGLDAANRGDFETALAVRGSNAMQATMHF